MALWCALLVSPLVALSEETIAYALVPWLCESGHQWVLHAVKAIALAITVATTIAAWRARDDSSALSRDDAAASRTQFLALAGLGVSALSAFVIITMWMTTLAVAPCVR